MNVVYIQSYPIYHDGIRLVDWFKLENRDKWMPGITSECTETVELWVTADKMDINQWENSSADEKSTYESDDSPHHYLNYQWTENHKVRIRVFEANYRPGNTKNHVSKSMLAFARKCNVQLYLIKGVDGGLGLNLINKHIRPNSIPFVFIIGGKCESNLFRFCHTIFYESEAQRKKILKPKWNWFKRITPSARIRKLPKSVDTNLFRPDDNIPKEYDIITTGRLIPYYKNYDVLYTLSKSFKIGVIGGGPLLGEFQSKYPQIDWLGHIQHHEIPLYLNKARCFLYTSKNDYFPRAITEAAATGLPVIGFDQHLSDDVIPKTIGFLVNSRTFEHTIASLLSNPIKIDEYSRNAREFALKNWGKFSVKSQVEELLNSIKSQETN
jgi:glycosyltransferase involved in cell wall biosynthesis